ncbi:MAG TPA: 1-acyl-sn-glycerol-3-phosphate acyltransferase, partial [Cellvibrionaceae bacterium]|nr:1-acyl-sn-glycerol-3-phosphate acyltransferase [Cellvibrionaceae bacterium]
MSEFDDIRPYNDDEVKPTLERLLNDSEFLDTIASLKLPAWLKSIRPLVRPLIKRRLSREVSGISSVFAFQQRIEYYMGQMLEKTITHLTISGLDRLDKNSAYCFISNHRDISMDPAFVNWALFHGGYQTLRIAIGDNLLTKPFASDLMRLNKSFIVNRSATAPREKFKVAKKLSHYIQHSMHEDQANIWIAQREGRAKDGNDKTNP